jgi:hypothetical protein
MLYVEFGLGAVNVGPEDDQLLPAAVVPIVKMGLQKRKIPSPLTRRK